MSSVFTVVILFGAFTLLSPSSALLWNDLFDNAVTVILLTALTVGVSAFVFFFSLYVYLGYFPLRAVLVGLVFLTAVSTIPLLFPPVTKD